MKRIISILAILFVALLCFASCDGKTTKDPTLIELNDLMALEDNNYTLNVTVESANGAATHHTYVVKETNGVMSVHQKIETLNKFTVENGSASTPSSYSTVEQKDLKPYEIMNGNYELPEFGFYDNSIGDYFGIGTKIEGDIKSLKAFMGLDIKASDAKVKVVYNYVAISSITVTYVSESGSHVTLEYILK